jgi:hypothetical protein
MSKSAEQPGAVSLAFQRALPVLVLMAAFASTTLLAADYHVGDGQPLATISAVPWQSLLPGDTVWIHWRATPYREKWVIGREGLSGSPISVRGVPGPAGQRPVIDGENATTPPQLNFWNEGRSVIKVGGSNTPSNDVARWIVIEGLDVRGARAPNMYTGDDNLVHTYSQNAAAIHIELGEHITIRNCIIRDSGNGLFVSSADENVSRDILIEGNYIHSNGNSGSIFEHNTYTAAIGIVYQYNRFGPLLADAGGNNLKDRSAGQVVRYNWIEGGNRQLDLVDAEDSTLIRDDPAYHRTDVYGNVLIEPAGAGNKQIIHYGGDSGTLADYRKGFLYLYHNTIISTRTDSTTLMRLSSNDEHCDARDNIIYVTTAGNALALLDSSGVLDFKKNWLKPGYVSSFGGLTGTINNDGTSITGALPGFVDFAGQDFTLAAGSACLDVAIAVNPAVLPDGAITRQYVRHQSSEPRAVNGAASDIGAIERMPPACVGDLDCDGDRDLTDVTVFVTVLINPAGYTGCDIMRADMNGDGAADGKDISVIIAAIVSGPCS